MRCAGTEYFTIRTVIIEDRSTRGLSTSPGSNTSTGNGRRSGCSAREVLADGVEVPGDPAGLVGWLPTP